MARGCRKNRRNAQNHNNSPHRNSIRGILDKDDDLQMRDAFQPSQSNRQRKATNARGPTPQKHIVPFNNQFTSRDSIGPGRGNRNPNQNLSRRQRQRERNNNNARQNGNHLHNVATTQNQLISQPCPYNHHQLPPSPPPSPEPQHPQRNLRTCTECSATRRANLTLRDWLSQSYLNTANVITSWSEEVGVGAESADEMDWQPEPVVRVLVLRDRVESENDSISSPSVSLPSVAGMGMMGFADGRSTQQQQQEFSGYAPHYPPWNNHHYCPHHSTTTCKESRVSNVFNIRPRREGWGMMAGTGVRTEGLGVLERKRLASGELVRGLMSPPDSSPSIS
ncbi:hypothetical protein GGR57DRAFT_510892 [Xylariaceae sp. FL1272]|nr:hypothetical protein GGR57DRAFT_510892 [Xylariaceae sp. FL1272]